MIILTLTFFLNACGVFKAVPSRRVASENEYQEISNLDFEEKLLQMHLYYVIGQQQLMLFDEQINSSNIDEIYEKSLYLKIQAVRTQVDEIEHEIIDMFMSLVDEKKKQLMVLKIAHFAEKSQIHAYSVENLRGQLKIKTNVQLKRITKLEIETEVSFLRSTSQYQVFEKNIEHLSFMLESRNSETSKRFYPSTTKAGNVSGNEFPTKVWSLTFDDGPQIDTSIRILEELKSNKLRATFFQLTQKAKTNPSIANHLRSEGMEIAAHSYSHKELTKVGASSLEKEITTAVLDLNKIHGTKMKYFRLPHGAGLKTSNIREKMAANGLIHVSFNVDSLDWMPQPPKSIVTRAIALMKKTHRDAGVIIFHDIHNRTAEALPEIIQYLKKDNRRICTIDEIVTQMNESAENICPQN